MNMRIKEKFRTSMHSTFSEAKTGVDHTKNLMKFKKVTIDATKPQVLNPIDYKYLRSSGAQSVDHAGSQGKEVGEAGAPPTLERLKIPKIDCRVQINQFQLQVKENREKKRKKAEKLYKMNQKKELIAKVQSELHRKDSTEILMEQYLDSLHKMDHIEDSPRENRVEDLLTIDETLDDPYSRKQKMQTMDPVTGKPIAEYDNDPKVDMHILQMCSNIRTEQNWVNPAQDLDLEDFNGDLTAFQMAKIENGVRMLSQEEKILMFAIADGRMKDGINDIKRLAGLWPPIRKDKRQSLKAPANLAPVQQTD